jgi:hypothetical protein
MEQLLEDYKRKFETIKQMIADADDEGESESTMQRLKTKKGMIASFIVDIERAMADTSNENSGLHLQHVSQRSELLAIEALKKITKTHEETWSKQIATEALQSIANCG